jgi:flotillin
MGSFGGYIAAVLTIGFFAFVFLLVLVKRMLYICSPNEVLIFSGKRRLSQNREVGYRIIKGGRAIRIPLLETVDRMDLTNMIIHVETRNAYSKGGIPLTLQGVANIKVPGEEPLLNNTLERFLGRQRNEIMGIAKDTLEGNLRGVLAQLTAEQVNEDKQLFEQKLLEEAEHDLNRLGLVLDTLKIQNIADDVGYLTAIGRRRSAEVRKNALIAEARAKADSLEQQAKNLEATRLAQVNAEIKGLQAVTEKRIADAETKRTARMAEAQAEVAAVVSRSKGELELQKQRIEQVRRRLNADVIQPALAMQRAAEERAKGDAASIVENGRAVSSALRNITVQWRQAGAAAREVFLMQKLEILLAQLVTTIQDVKVGKMTVIGGSGTGANGGGGSLAARLVSGIEQVKAATGVDLAAAAQKRLG